MSTYHLARPIRTAVTLLGIAAICAGLVFDEPYAHAATLPAGFTESVLTTGLPGATAMAIAPDGRIFVCLQDGQLRVIKNGALLPTPFVTLTVNSSGERGLLGVTFHPGFADNPYVYVYYTATTPVVHNRVSRFKANGDVAGSEEILLDLEPLDATNHNGGAMHFGSDGKLYVAVGENAVGANAQSLNTLLGKILRINADGSIPDDNPFEGTATGENRAIWARGLRNPYTFAFQRGTARMFINDVGQNTWEEINDGLAGANYGWPNCEGACSPPNESFRDPIFQYQNDGSTCAITGGAFYNPVSPQFPATYLGDYFFADFCGGWIRHYDPANGSVENFASGIANPVDLRVGEDGSLYYLARGNGSVVRVQWGASPTMTGTPTAGSPSPNSTQSPTRTAALTATGTTTLTTPTLPTTPAPPTSTSAPRRGRGMHTPTGQATPATATPSVTRTIAPASSSTANQTPTRTHTVTLSPVSAMTQTPSPTRPRARTPIGP